MTRHGVDLAHRNERSTHQATAFESRMGLGRTLEREERTDDRSDPASGGLAEEPPNSRDVAQYELVMSVAAGELDDIAHIADQIRNGIEPR